jgi:outer membrane protein OmpU
MEINMKNITKIGLSALAGTLAITSANAGDLSLSGSMEASYTTGGGYTTTGNPLGMDKELSITGSGELDNGMAISYKQTSSDALAFNDSEIKVDTGSFGTIALTSTGSPISAIDDVTPTAFEEANALLGSIDDVNGSDGTYGIRYTYSDILGSGMKADVMYFPKHGAGDANADNSSSGDSAGGEAWEYTLTGSLAMLPGLSFGAGYVDLEKDLDAVNTSDDIGQDEGTAYLKYAYGPVTVGYQVGAVSGKAAGSADYKNTYIGISYAVTDDLSVSYNTIESLKMPDEGTTMEQDFDSFSVSYSMGGMTLSLADSDCGNCSYNSGRSRTATSVSMAVAF